jgi:hypothetical protein
MRWTNARGVAADSHPYYQRIIQTWLRALHGLTHLG